MADVRLTATNPEDSSVVPVACNAKGELLLEEPLAEFDGNVDGDLTVTGSASFANGYAGITESGWYTGTGFVSYKTAASSFSIHNDDIEWQYSVYHDGTTHIGGTITTNDSTQDSPNIALKADGSATFAGTIQCGVTNANQGTGTWIQEVGGVYTTRPAGSTAPVFTAYRQGAVNSPTVEIKADGSASFAGAISSGSNWTIDSTKQGCTLFPTGQANYYYQTTIDQALATWFTDVGGTQQEKIRFRTTGVITASNVTFNLEADNPANYTTTMVDGEEQQVYNGPTLDARESILELTEHMAIVERELQRVLEKLRMAPEAGWEVWDGSDEN